jgi:3-oxosteroid 1-dehydrogenase
VGEETFDWIAVGSGCAGLAGALWAAARGLRALVVEKSDRLGGQTGYSYASIWAPLNPLASAEGIPDTPAEARLYLEWLSAQAADADRLSAYVADIGPAIGGLSELGVGFQLVRGVPDHHHPSAPGSKQGGRLVEPAPCPRSALPVDAPPIGEGDDLPPGVSWSQAVEWGGFGNRFRWDPERVRRAAGFYAMGPALLAWLLRACLRAGVAIRPGHAVEALAARDGRVGGIVVRAPGGRRTELAARAGVLLATRGYEYSPDLARRFGHLPQCAPTEPDTSTGDGIVLAEELGAATAVLPEDVRTKLGYWEEGTATPRFHEAGINELVYPHSLIVNATGRRFGNESFFQDFMTRLQGFDSATHRHANIPCYLIFDAQFARRYSFAGNPPGAPIPTWVPGAPSLHALASRLGIDAGGFAEAVERFNRFAAEGQDPDFGRGGSSWARSIGDLHHPVNPNLAPVCEPPFYGVALYPDITSHAGLVCDAWGRVRHVRGRAIPGLYAAGIVTVPNHYGVGYQNGLSVGGALVFSRRAVAAATGEAGA